MTENVPQPTGGEAPQASGPLTNRTWNVLTTGALLVLGVDGVVTLFGSGTVEWANLVALVLGVTNLVDLIRRWRDIG